MSNQDYLKEDQEAIEKVKKLFESGQEENVALALQLIESGGVSADLLTHLFFIKAFFYDRYIAHKAYELFCQNASEELIYYVHYRWDDALSIYEQEINQFLTKTESFKNLETSILANLIFKYTNRGASYCIKNNTQPIQNILEAIIDDESLSFYYFKLDELPSEIGLFTDIKHLVLSYNNFVDIPDTLANLVNLESIEIDEVPLSGEAIKKLEGFFPKAMAEYYYQLATSYDENLDQSNIYMKQAIDLDKDNSDYWVLLGIITDDMGQQNTAIAYYDQAILLDKNNAVAFVNKTRTLGHMGYYEEALKSVENGIEVYNPSNHSDDLESALYCHKGLSLFYLKNHAEALAAYDKSIQISPYTASAWYNKSCLYSKEENKPEMLKNLQESILLDEKFKNIASSDKDFEEYWQDEDFLALVNE